MSISALYWPASATAYAAAAAATGTKSTRWIAMVAMVAYCIVAHQHLALVNAVAPINLVKTSTSSKQPISLLSASANDAGQSEANSMEHSRLYSVTEQVIGQPTLSTSTCNHPVGSTESPKSLITPTDQRNMLSPTRAANQLQREKLLLPQRPLTTKHSVLRQIPTSLNRHMNFHRTTNPAKNVQEPGTENQRYLLDCPEGPMHEECIQRMLQQQLLLPDKTSETTPTRTLYLRHLPSFRHGPSSRRRRSPTAGIYTPAAFNSQAVQQTTDAADDGQEMAMKRNKPSTHRQRIWNTCPESADLSDCLGNFVRLYLSTRRQLQHNQNGNNQHQQHQLLMLMHNHHQQQQDRNYQHRSLRDSSAAAPVTRYSPNLPVDLQTPLKWKDDSSSDQILHQGDTDETTIHATEAASDDSDSPRPSPVMDGYQTTVSCDDRPQIDGSSLTKGCTQGTDARHLSRLPQQRFEDVDYEVANYGSQNDDESESASPTTATAFDDNDSLNEVATDQSLTYDVNKRQAARSSVDSSAADPCDGGDRIRCIDLYAIKMARQRANSGNKYVGR